MNIFSNAAHSPLQRSDNAGIMAATPPGVDPAVAAQFFSPTSASQDSTFTLDEYNNSSRFQALQTELRDLLFTGVQTAQASPSVVTGTDEASVPASFEQPTAPTRLNLHDQLRSISIHISMQAKLDYLQNYMNEVAPWLDMFNQSRHFGLDVPVLAQRSPAVLSALLAVAARQKERRRGLKGASLDSLDLYSQAISALTAEFKVQEPEALTTACLLCVLEMLSANPRDWRRHLDGCAALFQASNVHGFSGGCMQAVFWCYARMDLIEAMIADHTESTVLPIQKWVQMPSQISSSPSNTRAVTQSISDTFLERGRATPDMHANYAIYLAGKACDLLTRRTRFLEMNDPSGCGDQQYVQEWNQHWDELQRWYDQRPQQMVAAQIIPGKEQNQQFPQIFFSHWAAISSNQQFHTACILLLNSKPSALDLDKRPQSARRYPEHSSKLWHARQVIGISATNPHPGCLNNAIQPLYIAGRLFSHIEEQRIVVKLLNHIEAASGWGSRWRIADLETDWGYPRGFFS